MKPKVFLLIFIVSVLGSSWTKAQVLTPGKFQLMNYGTTNNRVNLRVLTSFTIDLGGENVYPIMNKSDLKTGSLRLVLYASLDRHGRHNYTIGETLLDPLEAFESYTKIEDDLIAKISIPDGTYFLILRLYEYTHSGWSVRDGLIWEQPRRMSSNLFLDNFVDARSRSFR